MSSKPVLRIDLGDLDPYFERFATAKGQPVSAALGDVLESFLSGFEQRQTIKQDRVFRSVNFASDAEREKARELAQRLDLQLGKALRLVALEQLFAHLGSGTVSQERGSGVPSGGVLAVVGAGESPSLRLELRLTVSEMDALEKKAHAGRYRSVQAMVVAITRAFLFNGPVLDPAVVATLGRGNLELVRISNYIGQLTRDVAGGKRFGPLEAADVLAAIARIEAHTADVAKALAEAQGRWVIKDRELIDGNDR